MNKVKLELTWPELFRLEAALVEHKVQIEKDIDYWIKRLNGSNNTAEVKLCNGILKSKRERLEDITNILDKI